MSRAIKTLPVIACALALAGCANPFGKEGYFRDKSGDYTQARVTEPLVIPEQMAAEPMVDSLSIPPISTDHSNLEQNFSVPRPDQRLTQKEGEAYTIEREGDDQWLLVSKTPGEVWPKVMAFLEENDIPITTQNVKQGYLETDWADLGKDKESGYVARTFSKLVGSEVTGPMEDRFLFEVKQGVHPDSAEVHLKHMAKPTVAEGDEPAPEPENWNNLPERSQSMDDGVLNELLLFMIKDESDRSVSYLAQDLNLGNLAVLEQDGAGNPLLRLDQLSFARSWSAVDSALEKAGVDVTDKNRSAGIFYLQVDPKGVVKKEKESGWFSGWFSSEEKEEPKDLLLMRVTELNGVIRVSVEKDANTSAPAEISQKLLNLVKENLK
jgi:outer membrane protein assembly factor BamC